MRLVTCPRPPDQHECIEVGPDCGGVDTDAVVHSEPQLLGNVSLVWYLQIPTVRPKTRLRRGSKRAGSRGRRRAGGL